MYSRRHALTDTTLREIGTQARDKFEDLQDQGIKLSKTARRSVVTYVHKKPWVVVGLFSFFAAMTGFIFGRRGKYQKYSRRSR